MDDGMVVASLKVRLRPLGVTPIGAVHLAPPRRGGRGLGQLEVGWQEADEDERPAVLLGNRHPLGLLDEGCKALVRNGVRIHPKGCYLNGANRPFAITFPSLVVLIANHVGTTRNRHQLGAMRGRWGCGGHRRSIATRQPRGSWRGPRSQTRTPSGMMVRKCSSPTANASC
ncbi:unannotated protein [freshwater metagenome]|uniref:Unannotated protein n=1 Tax=freshwater metagenome TaxID=449393 RepID=A0A6J7IWN1_9ZZZZ